jgi:hypothetical protein
VGDKARGLPHLTEVVQQPLIFFGISIQPSRPTVGGTKPFNLRYIQVNMTSQLRKWNGGNIMGRTVSWGQLLLIRLGWTRIEWHSSIYKSLVYSSTYFPRSASPAGIMQFLLIHIVDYLAISLSLYLLAVFRDHRRRRGLPYPPGPSPRPIIGNLLDVPRAKEAPWIMYAEMSKKYGRRNILVAQVHSG